MSEDKETTIEKVAEIMSEFCIIAMIGKEIDGVLYVEANRTFAIIDQLKNMILKDVNK